MPANALTVELHTAAGALPILGGEFGFDRSWAPQGQGSVTVPADHPAAAALDPDSEEPVVLWIEVRHSESIGIGELQIAGAIAGMTWPAETPATYKVHDDFDDRIDPTSHAWRVWVRGTDTDDRTRETTVELATIELRLIDLVNLSGLPWQAQPVFGQPYWDPADMLRQLRGYAGLALTVEGLGEHPLYDQPPPWKPGQSAWEWWDALRIEAQTVYELNPDINAITVQARSAFFGWVEPTTAILERRERVALDAASGEQQYADAVHIRWSWTDDAGVEQSLEEVALAPGLTDWRDAKRTRTIDMDRAPIPGYPQYLVQRLSRARREISLTRPVTPEAMHTLQTFPFETIRYSFGDQPEIACTLIGE